MYITNKNTKINSKLFLGDKVVSVLNRNIATNKIILVTIISVL